MNTTYIFKTAQGLRVASITTLAVLLSACGGGETAKSQAAQGNATVEPTVSAQAVHPSVKYPDHHEFEAALDVPFVSNEASGARTLSVLLDYPGAPDGQLLAYQVELLNPAGTVVQEWSGLQSYAGKPQSVRLAWAGRSGDQSKLADGIYTVRMTALSADAEQAPKVESSKAKVAALLAGYSGDHAPVTQSWPLSLGKTPRVAMPTFKALAIASNVETDKRRAQAATPATGSWPYTIYYGTFHGQTNDSDGGGAIATCSSSLPAQSGEFGPDAAFPYAKNAGLDFLANTDHNHYFDGSTGTNTSASSSVAKARYQNGLTIAANYTAATPGFLALYGMEWGVISNGGHLNIFNSNELFSWEYNGSGELFGDRYTSKTDYAALYTTMRTQGLVGQFNHPDSTGQFVVNGVDLGYTADGDEVMVMAEIMNTSAFSSNTTETETSRSLYEGSYKKLLERGFHVAPATNQDNHCANWGLSYTNRTAVLIPNGTALTKASMVEALRARRVFATMDKNSQVVLSANGHIMGERFDNIGPLNLNVGYANPNGRTVALTEIYEGVPGRNGTVSLLSNSPAVSITPSMGKHFYYAKLTQDDGKVLWSAPLWVNQTVDGADQTPPTVSASVTGNTGTITLNATASDNVGVTKVELWLDGGLKTTLTSAPYKLDVDSSLLANGTHSLVAKAFDAAGNSTTSSPVSFEVSNVSAGMTESESNNTIAKANAVGKRATVNGFIGTTSDKDYFSVSLAANQRIRVDMVGPSGTDYDLYLVTSSGAGLARSESSTSSESMTYTNTATARTVYIKVQSYAGSSTTMGYTLTISYP
ncbi:CehA/McbA family metallohydrolase [Paucibacter sp. JuS9]|uniref:CehA/McbA family metallohydrolase n=1 Tax=Paucibacter sp. JuS9 TaxID=3228748 RepID=UPI00375719EA